MGSVTRSVLRVALRAWIARQQRQRGNPAYTPPHLPWPEMALIFDAETTTDPTQRLLFGSWRLGRFGAHGSFECLEEGLFYDDDLPTRDPAAFAILQQYARDHQPETSNRRRAALLLRSRREFVQEQLWKAMDGGALLVGYNLGFDLSRIAVAVGESRHPMFTGGFSFSLFEYEAQPGVWRENPHRPRLRLKSLADKRALMGLARRKGSRPEERKQPLDRLGRLLDLKHLTFALTDQHLTLDRAAELFGLATRKLAVETHGVVSEDYITYNRQDVAVTAALLEAVRAEWERHPLALTPDKVMSPAALGKGYLRAMGIVPPGRKFDLGDDLMGHCLAAYFGGRTEVRVRRQIVPVVYLDFLSMYPTVNTLLGLWKMLTAAELKVYDATAHARELVASVTLERCFKREFWPELRFFAKIRPQGDILPVRAAYGPTEDNTTIGVNPLTSDVPVWVAGPDLVASVLLTGQEPEILEAFRLAPVGQQEGLTPVALRGQVEIDPRKVDFFQRVIEERQRAKRRPDLPEPERERLQRFLKVAANSSSYGIFAELNPQPVTTEGPVAVEVHGLEEMFPTSTGSPEEPGEFCFPPFAALTTAAARLMLAMVERAVRDLGGEIAFGDTDSAAVVATKDGGLVPCAGAPLRGKDGAPALRALSWAEVRALSERFRSLSPYDRDVVKDSILKLEDVNYDPATKALRPLYAFAISAKRYALFVEGPGGAIEVVDAKEHGLGHLLNPVDLSREDRDWIRQVWAAFIREARGEPLALPIWVDRPAVSRVGVSTWGLYQTYATYNAERAYADQIKPMNFALSVTVARFGHPEGCADPGRFHLLAPFERDPSRWLMMPWLDKYSGARFQIGVGRATPGMQAQVKSYRDVVEEYRVHPEPKSLDASGVPCGPESVGLLRRRPVELGELIYVGKESNALEQVMHGLIHRRGDVQPIYPAPHRSLWQLVYQPAIRRIPVKRLKEVVGLGARIIHFWRSGEREPSPGILKLLQAESRRWASQALADPATRPEDRVVAERVSAVSPPPYLPTTPVERTRRRRRKWGKV